MAARSVQREIRGRWVSLQQGNKKDPLVKELLSILTVVVNTQKVAQLVKHLPAGDLGSIPGLGRSLEKGMATHSSTLAWGIPQRNLAGYSP